MKPKKTIYILLAAAILGVAIVLFLPKKKDTPIVNEKALNIPFQKKGELTFIDGETNDTLSVIEIEVADNDQLRARGLMYRSSIPENGGMLFIHDAEDIQSFWMKNTYISLDMIFINAQKEIVTIHAGTEPLKEWSYASTAPALYVVEVNAGYCTRNAIQLGDKIEFLLNP